MVVFLLSPVRDEDSGVPVVVGAVLATAFVDAGGGFGGGGGGIVPPDGGGISAAGAGLESGIYLYLYFAEEFQARYANLFL